MKILEGIQSKIFRRKPKILAENQNNSFGKKPKILEENQNKTLDGNRNENFRMSPKQIFQKETKL